MFSFLFVSVLSHFVDKHLEGSISVTASQFRACLISFSVSIYSHFAIVAVVVTVVVVVPFLNVISCISSVRSVAFRGLITVFVQVPVELQTRK